MDTFTKDQTIRQLVSGYPDPTSREALEGIVSEEMGEDISSGDIENTFYAYNEPLGNYATRARQNEAALERLNTIFNTPVSRMSEEEMSENIFSLFIMTKEQYKSLLESAGFEPSEKIRRNEYRTDFNFIEGALKRLHGKETSKEELKEAILQTDFKLGYFDNDFKNGVRDLFESTPLEENLEGLRSQFQGIYRAYNSSLSNLKQYDEKLKSQSKMPQPEKFETITADITPLEIAFHGQELVVLGKSHNNLCLEVYDPGGKKINSKDIGLQASLLGNWFLGSLSIGSNDIIYAVSHDGVEEYHKNLDHVVDNISGFHDALASVRKHFPSHPLLQVTEKDGVHYFVLSKLKDFTEETEEFTVKQMRECVLTAWNGYKNQGRLFDFKPYGNGGTPESDFTPRMQIHGNNIYMKNNHDIISIDKSLLENDKSHKVIEGEQLYSEWIPSNHCLDNEGNLWAVTRDRGEPTASIKAYTSNGDFLTHMYPENYPGGGAALRSMAISEDGILAYTNFDKKQIDLYRIKK